ncbi:MAG: alpha/beta fold hydrolase [Bryobacteraceae bacterium]|nr:alpha/beta fold hydrolase [Bryobacteraceae bacterium]
MRMVLLFLLGAVLAADDGQRLLRVDHYVRVRPAAQSRNGQASQIYVREVVQAGTALRAGAREVILFVHGAGTPAEVAFDVPYRDYSWMAFLARAGYDVFAMDMTGYGRSTRPDPMNDPCNLSKEQREQLGAASCPDPADGELTTLESDWRDIEGVVEYLRKLRAVSKVNLVGWSLGGPRAGGYAARHPEKVAKMVLLAPAYRASQRTAAGPRAMMNTQSRADLDANWDRQLGCPDQFEMAARESVWAAMLEADPVGATWGTGVRRAPNVRYDGTGWNAAVVGRMRTPVLFVAPAHDAQVPPESVRTLYDAYGAPEKAFVDLACSSHNALWERNHLLLFRASLEWFSKGTVNGKGNGALRLGY